MCIKKKYDNACWLMWPHDLKLHKNKVLEEFKKENFDYYCFMITIQYMAFSQFIKLRKYANRNGVKIIGDLPIYVALDSADAWSHRKEFLFDSHNNPSLVAGVPPDYFSVTGQLWGNPLYDYKKMEKNNFKWWKNRLKNMSKLVDVIRIDHFRGFASFYTIKYGAKNAMEGKWEEGPKEKIIDVLKEVKNVEIIAEDLGLIDDEVRNLLEYSKFPGLKVLQFAFDSNDPNDAFLPHMYKENCVAYLGTHDNDVMTSFLKNNQETASKMKKYLECKDEEIIDKAMESLLNSLANVVIFQMQDIEKMSGESRMNIPGNSKGNWCFRIKKENLSKKEHWNCLN